MAWYKCWSFDVLESPAGLSNLDKAVEMQSPALEGSFKINKNVLCTDYYPKVQVDQCWMYQVLSHIEKI